MSARLPVLFLGHGSPMNAITDTSWRRSWEGLAARFPTPKAILCVSAHWETDGSFAATTETPKTIHDFYGFPDALFAMRYPAPGAPELAARAMALTGAQGDASWGLDHGAWSVLASLYPHADIPVAQFSLDRTKTPGAHYALGQALAPLRDEGVLILGSGNIVHNLRAWRGGQQRYDWAGRINIVMQEKIAAGDDAALVYYARLDPEIALAIPTNEHYLPLLYVLGARDKGEKTEIFNSDVTASIAMTSLIAGL
jgi:4,5-DOPA dioxygenase extradiol